MPTISPFVFSGDLSNRGPTRVRPSHLRLLLNITFLLFWCIVMPLVHCTSRFFGGPAAGPVTRLFHRGVARCFRLHMRVYGSPHTGGNTIWVTNHTSYLDVFLLGSLLDASFVAKSEVASWPVLGQLAKLQDTLFFERNPRRSREQIERLRAHLCAGRNLIIFPEGTSTDGIRVQPFRSTLLEAAASIEGLMVQPLSIAYTHYDGVPMAPADRDHYAWYSPMTFLPHCLRSLSLRRADIEIRFRAPVPSQESGNRKDLARHLEAEVRAGLVESLGDQVIMPATRQP